MIERRIPKTRRAVLAGMAALALAPALAGPADAQNRDRTIYVVSIGWHAGIAIPRTALAESGLIPEIADFPDADYIEFGWGDRDYYMDADPSVFDALAAGIGSSPAVLHLIGMEVEPQRYFRSAEVLAVPVSDAMLTALIRHIDADFDRSGRRRAPAMPSAIVRGARFYPAHGGFHLFNTCNTWVARALGEAGLDISGGGVITADDLLARVRDLPGVAEP